MSAVKKEILIVDVTRGDCLEANRKTGKSNTGTYFISSLKDFDKYKVYFENEDKFIINLSKIKEYMILFKNIFIDSMEEYIGKGANFDYFCNLLLSLEKNPRVDITLRINDSRVFMRFKDNTNPIVNAFRNLLYEDITFICIEKVDKLYEIYPMINSTKSKMHFNTLEDGFIFDD